MWTVRISGACRELDISYSRLIQGLKKAEVGLNRKMLSEIAYHDAEGFKQIVALAKKSLA
jgi:large subunit ribosomal protein L20